MNILQLIEKFTINPKDDVEPIFQLDKQIKRDLSGVEKFNHCLNCGDPYNSRMMPSSPWTAVQVCTICRHINVVYYQDRMGGADKDIIKCYGEKN